MVHGIKIIFFFLALGQYHFLPGGGGGTVKFVGESLFFCCPERGITFLLVPTKSYKHMCTTYVQHVIEYDSGLL